MKLAVVFVAGLCLVMAAEEEEAAPALSQGSATSVLSQVPSID